MRRQNNLRFYFTEPFPVSKWLFLFSEKVEKPLFFQIYIRASVWNKISIEIINQSTN